MPGGDGQHATLAVPGHESIDLGEGYVHSVSVTPDGDLVMLALPDGEGRSVLRTVDPDSGTVEHQSLPSWLLATAVDVAADGTIVVLGDRDNCCLNDPHLIVLPRGQSPRSVDLGEALHPGPVTLGQVGIAVSPQGLVAISQRTPEPLARGGVEHPGWTVVVDQSGRLVTRLDGWHGLAWSPDGSGLLAAQRTGERTVDLRVWFGKDLAEHTDIGFALLPLTPVDWAASTGGPSQPPQSDASVSGDRP